MCVASHRPRPCECGVRRREIDAAHPGLGGEGHEGGVRIGQRLAAAEAEALFGQDDDRAAFRGFVGQRGESAARPGRSAVDAGPAMNSVAMAVAEVMVPVLSSSSTSTSPAASTARPLVASTLRCTRRSMPLMPIALSNPPMVVGIRHTSRATRT
jgi:hypothetical protein